MILHASLFVKGGLEQNLLDKNGWSWCNKEVPQQFGGCSMAELIPKKKVAAVFFYPH